MPITVSDIDLRALPFSSRASRLMIAQDALDSYDHAEPLTKDEVAKRLYIAAREGGRTREFAELRPLIAGETADYRYRATNSLLMLTTEAGTVELCFDDDGTLRIRGSAGVSLRVAGGEGLYIAALKGEVRALDSTRELYGDDGGFEGLISPDGEPAARTADFDACVKARDRELTAFTLGFQQPAGAFQQAWLCAVYGIWCTGLKTAEPLSLSLQAIAECADTDAAVELLRRALAAELKTPVEGFALTYIMDKTGTAFTARHAEALYKPLSSLVRRWTERINAKTGLAAYSSQSESCFPGAACFARGLPVATPELNAFLALSMDCCGRLARILGLNAEAERWDAQAKRLVFAMKDGLWSGEGFRPCLAEDGGRVDCDSLLNYVPLCLGKLLPRFMLYILTEKLSAADAFISYTGLRSESAQSLYFDEGDYAGLRGALRAELQLIMLPALYNAGKRAAALSCAYGWCAPQTELGIQTSLRILRVTVEGEDNKEVERYMAAPGKLCPAEAHEPAGDAAFIVLASLLAGDGFEE